MPLSCRPASRLARRRVLAAGLLLSALAALPGAALAAPVAATVVQLSGAMLARKPDGSVKPLALRSEVESGDTLLTQAGAYAQLRFIDNSEVIMKPSTTLQVEQFAFARGKQADDQASFQLLKGGMRSVSGLLGQRSKEKFLIRTPSANIGIRGTTFILEFVEAGAAPEQAAPPSGSMIPPAPPPAGGLPPGLHVYVSDGGISVTNQAGVGQYDPGQFGYIKDLTTKPVKMTANPGIQFSPPASFSPPPPADAY
ncbi:FecR family protein [Pseudoduganella aquatica]|uniref:Iron dicitrate transport regulator FecR n=1 Tax=Pseudoduganella aquatica TaxID=2660641 RepID=A0A7X4HDQ5_9BURK|nr:FecR domain-containing protein [Pseudoduganella aquatica]MYN08315.1 iron dicitrate transport regulator FecR [Pseudoduganella aquatica]